MIWRTKDGRRLRIEDMGDQHLYNSIKMLERQEREDALTRNDDSDLVTARKAALKVMRAELQSRTHRIEPQPQAISKFRFIMDNVCHN